jgi:hypothetical protein
LAHEGYSGLLFVAFASLGSFCVSFIIGTCHLGSGPAKDMYGALQHVDAKYDVGAINMRTLMWN